MSKKSRDKGKRGERLIIDWLQPISDELHEAAGLKPVLLQRNTIQSDCGGSDIVGLRWLAAEVKNCESQGPALLDSWWQQCVEQTEEGQTSILFYTRARAPIRVRMLGWAGGHISGLPDAGEDAEPDLGVPLLVDISAEAFEIYFAQRLAHELAKRNLALAAAKTRALNRRA